MKTNIHPTTPESPRAIWSAPAERSGDGAFGRHRACEICNHLQSGVALRFPPHSKTMWNGIGASNKSYAGVRHILVYLTALVLFLHPFNTDAATNDVSSLLQKGLFEEEANLNLEAAIQSYQAVIAQTEKDRQFAATAIYHLAECYRKLGRTNEAAAQYTRIIREFPDQAQLAELSRKHAGQSAAVKTAPQNADAGAKADDENTNEVKEDLEVARIKEQIKDNPDLVNSSINDSDKRTPLHRAASRNQLQVARFLLANRANPNLAESRGYTPLYFAVTQGNKEMVELLLANGADPNIGQVATVPNHGDFETPLCMAAEKGYKSIAEMLIASKVEVDRKSMGGVTPLYVACSRGFKAVAEVLIAAGADVNATVDYKRTPLINAADIGNEAMVELLLSHGASADAADESGLTALMCSAYRNSLAIAKTLLEHKADVNAAVPVGPVAGYWTSPPPRGSQLARLLGIPELGPYLNKGQTALFAAVAGSHAEMVRLLVSHGAAVDARASARIEFPNLSGLESWTKNNGMVPLLPRQGQSASVRPGCTALMLACFGKDAPMADLLLRLKADPNSVSDDGGSPLIIAAQQNQPEIMRALVSAGAGVNFQDDVKASILHWAVVDCDSESVKFLLEHGAKVDAQDDNGATPLHLAAELRKEETCRVLLESKAEPNARDQHGYTPLDWLYSQRPYLTENERNPVVTLLREHDAIRSWDVSTIRVKSINGDGANPIFYSDKSGRNRYTLFELIALCLSMPQQTYIQFPDLQHIDIQRLDSVGKRSRSTVDLDEALKNGDCAKDQVLSFGDIVSFPVLDHNLNESWHGLSPEASAALEKCLARKIKITVKSQTQEFELLKPPSTTFAGGVNFTQVNSGTTTIPVRPVPVRSIPQPIVQAAPTPTSGIPQIRSFDLTTVIQQSGMIRASSDLTRVKVRRTVSGSPVEFICNASEQSPNDSLKLENGDEIEVPEKP